MKTPLFFQRRFWPMWTALSLGAFADNMLRQALLVGVPNGFIAIPGFERPDDALPILGSLFAVAMLVFSSISGQFADKYETAMMFRRTKFVEVVLMALAAIGFALNSGALLTLVLLAMGAQSAFFSPVRMGAMPKYLHADELVRGNGLCNAGLYVSILLGLFLGGLLIALEGGRYKVSLFLFGAALLGWLAALRAPPAPAGDPGLKIDWNLLGQSRRIVAYAFISPGVARPLLGAAFFFFVSTFVTVLVPLYARSALGADALTATALMGLFAIGAGVGAMLAAALSKRRSGLGFSTVGISLAAAAALTVYFVSDLPPAEGGRTAAFLVETPSGIALAIAFIASAAAMGLFIAPLQAAAQRRAPADKRSRIMAASNMINAAAAIVGSLSVFVVTRGLVGHREAFLLVAALQGLVAFYMWRRRARVPEGLHDEALTARLSDPASTG